VVSGPVGTGALNSTLPAGAQPTALVTTVEVAPGVTGGSIIFSPAVGTPDVVSVSSLDTSGLTHLTIPLTGRDIVDGVVSVGVRVDLKSPNASLCFPNGTGPQVTFTTGSVQFSDDAGAPTTVAGYLPSVLRRIAIWVPDRPTSSEEAAALQAVAVLTNLYPTAAVAIDPLPAGQSLPPAATFDRWDRNIVLKSGSAADAVVADAGAAPDLVITGDRTTLTSAVRALATPQFALASAPHIGRSTLDGNGFGGSSTLTFAQLGQNDPSMNGVGQMQISVPVAQDSFGGPIRSANVDISGIHTPVTDGALGTISLLWNNTLIASEQLGAGDAYRENLSVPAGLLQRDNYLTVQVDYTPAGGQCRVGVAPFQLNLDNSSSITVRAGQTLADGFERFPQTFSDKLPVALATNGITSLEDAGHLVADLQQMNSRVFQVSVTTVASVKISNESALVVGADPRVAAGLGVPLQLEPFRTIAANGIQVGLSVGQPFAALEGFSQGGRELLVLGDYDGATLEQSVVHEVSSLKGGWSALTGGALVVPSHGQAVMLSTDSVVPQPALVRGGSSLPDWAKALIALAIAAIVGRFIWAKVRRARLRSAVRRAEELVHDSANAS
jgi:hypothetical protein